MTYSVHCGSSRPLRGASLAEAVRHVEQAARASIEASVGDPPSKPTGMRIYDEGEGRYLTAFAVEYFLRNGELPETGCYLR